MLQSHPTVFYNMAKVYMYVVVQIGDRRGPRTPSRYLNDNDKLSARRRRMTQGACLGSKTFSAHLPSPNRSRWFSPGIPATMRLLKGVG